MATRKNEAATAETTAVEVPEVTPETDPEIAIIVDGGSLSINPEERDEEGYRFANVEDLQEDITAGVAALRVLGAKGEEAIEATVTVCLAICNILRRIWDADGYCVINLTKLSSAKNLAGKGAYNGMINEALPIPERPASGFTPTERVEFEKATIRRAVALRLVGDTWRNHFREGFAYLLTTESERVPEMTMEEIEARTWRSTPRPAGAPRVPEASSLPKVQQDHLKVLYSHNQLDLPLIYGGKAKGKQAGSTPRSDVSEMTPKLAGEMIGVGVESGTYSELDSLVTVKRILDGLALRAIGGKFTPGTGAKRDDYSKQMQVIGNLAHLIAKRVHPNANLTPLELESLHKLAGIPVPTGVKATA